MEDKMNFKELEKKVGFTLAVLICEDLLSKNFFHELSFEQLLKVHNEIPSKFEFNKKVLWHIKRFKQPFADWYEIAQNTDSYTWLYQLALKRMHEQVTTVEEWSQLLQVIPGNDKARAGIYKKMQRRAKTFDDWFVIWQAAPDKSKLELEALKKVKELAKTFADWHKIQRESWTDPKRLKLTFIKMNTLAKTFDDWYIHWHNLHNEKLESMRLQAEKQMKKQAKEVIHWFRIVCRTMSHSEHEALTKLALNKLHRLKGTFDQWLTIMHEASIQDMGMRDIAIYKMVNLAKTFKEWHSVWQCAYFAGLDENEVKELALKKMKELSVT